jgi:hypothetical protein
MSHKPEFDIDNAHRWFGAEFNNRIFPLLEKYDRTVEETEEMIAMAYASTLHWGKYSKHSAANRARGENMIATTLAYAGRKEAAMHHAKRNHDIVLNNKSEMSDFDVSYAFMAMARSLALNGDSKKAKEYYDKCQQSIEVIKDQKDKEIVESDFRSGPWYGIISEHS